MATGQPSTAPAAPTTTVTPQQAQAPTDPCATTTAPTSTTTTVPPTTTPAAPATCTTVPTAPATSSAPAPAASAPTSEPAQELAPAQLPAEPAAVEPVTPADPELSSKTAEPDPDWTPTEDPNATVVAGEMRSDREEIPAGATKEMADQAEIMEARQRMSRAAAGCQTYWPFPYEVCGAIRDKYNSLGGPGSFLSYPNSPEYTNPDGVGKRTQFLNGPIYWSPQGGAHPVVNSFLNRWGVHQYEAGFLKYPTTDEIVLPDGGRRQEFQQGAIYVAFQNAIGSAIANGPLRDKYNSVGGLAPGGTLLGYLTEDHKRTLPDGQGQMARFQNGVIYYSPATGAWPVLGTADLVTGKILGKWTATGLELGSKGYPIADQVAQNTGIPGDVKQAFQFGTLGWPTQQTDAPDVGSDWDEYESSCSECADDARVEVTGSPAYMNVPQPPATVFQGSNRSANPVADATEAEVLEAQPDTQILPPCDDLAPDPAAAPDALVWCAPTAEEAMELQARVSGTGTGGTNSNWTPAIQSDCLDEPQRQWVGTRNYQCMWRMDWANLRYRQNPTTGVPGGSPAGSVQYVQEFEAKPAYNSTNWVARAAIHIITSPGNGTGASYSLRPSCTSTSSSTCTPQGGGIGPIPISQQEDAVADFTINPGTIAAGTKSDISTYFTFRFTHPNADIPTVDGPQARFPGVRCDNAWNGLTGKGCVVPEADAVLNMSGRSTVTTHSQHIQRAQQSGLPGSAVEGKPLRRTTDQTRIANNRNATCNKVRATRPNNTDCDEYPFASTEEGGLNPGEVFRSFEGCQPPVGGLTILDPDNIENKGTGVSICYINRTDNRSGGGILSWFYRKQRIANSEEFYVN